MFHHILVPVDGSANADQAMEKALAIAQAFKSRVTVVSVIDNYAFTGVGVDFAYGQTEYLTAATAEAKQALDAACLRFEAAGIPVTCSLVEGHAVYKGILDTAAAGGADLVVMGSHGRKGLEKLVLGSVAAQVLSHASVPVLIVREQGVTDGPA
ncbi:MAG: universal stress protein [Polaromonas sp.]|nr:universal stress protein [Polaromonas sp.]